MGEKIQAWLRTPSGKAALIASGLVVLYLIWHYMHGSSQPVPQVVQSASPPSGGSDIGGGSGENLSAADKLSAWISDIEKKAIAGDPQDAALIDATLNDVSSHQQLTPAEESMWQQLLSQFGAPPEPLGNGLNLTAQSGDSPISQNGTSPSNSNLVPTPGTSVQVGPNLTQYTNDLGNTAVFKNDHNTDLIAYQAPGSTDIYHTPEPVQSEPYAHGQLLYVLPNGNQVQTADTPQNRQEIISTGGKILGGY